MDVDGLRMHQCRRRLFFFILFFKLYIIEAAESEITQLDDGKTAENTYEWAYTILAIPHALGEESLALVKYWSRLILSEEPVIVTCLLEELSTGLAFKYFKKFFLSVKENA